MIVFSKLKLLYASYKILVTEFPPLITKIPASIPFFLKAMSTIANIAM